MSDETPPPDSRTGALTRPERGSLGPPAAATADIDDPVESADQFEVSAKRVVSRTTARPPAGLELRTKILYFVIGALWGAVIGGSFVALMKVPAPTLTTAPTPADSADP